MIDIIGLFEQKLNEWNNIQKCGYCWEFEAPLRESDMNESEKKEEECCVRSFLTNLTVRVNRRYENGLVGEKVARYEFDLYFLKYDDIGLNTYEEMEGYPISESKWKKILLPLKECVSQGFDFCGILGRHLKVVDEEWETRIDFLDQNYTGWVVHMTIEDNEYDC